MRIGYKIFPYPILNSNVKLSNYLNCNFEIKYDVIQTDEKYIFDNLRFETNSSTLNNLYKEKKMKVVCIVECSDTVYRRYIEIDNINPIKYIIYKSDLSEKTNITFFAYASEDIILESNEFDQDYQEIKFQIDKYDILAADDERYFVVKHQQNESNLAKSIFSIINDKSSNDGIYSIDYSLNKITIYLSDHDYSNYKVIAGINEYKETFFNILLIPTLVEALNACKNYSNNATSIEDIGDNYHWFRSVMQAYKRLHNEDLTLEILKTSKTIELSQELLGKPLTISFSKMVNERIEIQENN